MAGCFDGAIERLRHEQIRRHRLAVRPRIVHELAARRAARDRCPAGNESVSRTGVGAAGRRVHDVEVGGVLRIGVLIEDLAAVGRPHRLNVRAAAVGDRPDPALPASPIVGDADVPRSRGSAPRSSRTRCACRPATTPAARPRTALSSSAPARRPPPAPTYRVIPAVAVAQERNPLAVRRRLRSRRPRRPECSRTWS